MSFLNIIFLFLSVRYLYLLLNAIFSQGMLTQVSFITRPVDRYMFGLFFLSWPENMTNLLQRCSLISASLEDERFTREDEMHINAQFMHKYVIEYYNILDIG